VLSLLSGSAGVPQSQADWSAVAALASRLWLEPRLAARVADNAHVPAELRHRWLHARRSTAARNLLFQNEEENLLRALQQAGVEAIPLKGTSLARILGDPAVRPVTDIDLGVRAPDVTRAADVLRDAGYALSLPSPLLGHAAFLTGTDEHTSEVKCRREWAGSQLAVELHWKWLPLPEAEVWDALQTYSPSGISTLGVEHYFLFLCSHAAGGSWAGLRWLCDIAEFLAVLGSGMDALRCLHLARRAGLRRAVGITLELIQRLFGVRFDKLDSLRDARACSVAQRYLRRPFDPFLSGSVAGIHRERLRVLDGTSRRAAYIARLLRPTFQEWTDSEGRLRPATSAWALRLTRLTKIFLPATRPRPAPEAQP